MGIDVGATNILGALVDADGRVVARTTAATPRADAEALVTTLTGILATLCEHDQLAGVGLAVAGRVEVVDGQPTIRSARVDWGGHRVIERFRNQAPAAVVVANDAQAAAWGERQVGAARGLTDFLLLTVGTGLGGGLVLGNRPYHGFNGSSGEVGHLTLVSPDGRACPCGKTGCWEQYASGTALVTEFRLAAEASPAAAATPVAMVAGDWDALTGELIAQCARAGDSMSYQAFEQVADAMARGILEVDELLNLQAVVLGGGVMDAGDILMAAVHRHLAALSAGSGRSMPELMEAELGRHAGVVGAALLALAQTAH